MNAAANLVDARCNRGLARNPSQTINAVVSVVTALAAAFAVSQSLYAVLAVFGAWAILNGLLQLAICVGRSSTGAQ